MLPILFRIGPITVYSYGFFLVLAYFAATFILWREGKRQGYNEEKLLDFSIISLIASLIGGRIYYVLLNWSFFAADPVNLLSFWDGGFAFHGSLVAVILVGIYFIRRWKWSFFQVADISAIAASAALTLGKLGAFLAGIDFGKVSDLPWAVRFPDLVGARHPVQLYEAAAYTAIFGLLYFFYFKILASKNMVSGKIFFGFLFLTSLARGALEFFRADSDLVFSIPVATIASVVVAAGSLVALYYFGLRNFREDTRTFLTFVFGLNAKILRKLKI